MHGSFWSFALTWPAVAAAATAWGLSAWLAWRLWRRSGRRRDVLAAEGVRLLGVALLAATLLRPERVRTTRSAEQPGVAVLLDASGSMATRDVALPGTGVLARAEWLARERARPFWKPLEARYAVRVTDFAAAPTGAAPAEAGTDLNDALERALAGPDDLRAVLLVSDGDWNLGRPPVSAATRLRLRDVPVYTVAAGRDRYLPDLELQSVAAPSYALLDEHVSVAFTVQSRLPRDVKTTLTVRGAGGPEATKELLIPAMAQVQDTVTLVPKAEGTYTFMVELPLEKDDVIPDNNTRPFTMALRREVLSVLLIDSEPRWEYRYLHNALDRDPGVDVKCLLFHPGMEHGQGRNYLAAFPATRDELSRFDVVFLGDVGIGDGQIVESEAALLKGLVEQQGSGLVFLPGRRGRQGTLAGSALAELLPVVPAPDAAGFGIAMESALALTTHGAEHFLTLLGPSPQANAEVWRRLPGFFWHAGVVRAKPGADVLAVHATARNEHGRIPLIVTRPAGNGKVLFMGTDSAWRWRRGVEDTYHYRFWGQVVRWMSHQRHLAHDEGIRFFFTPESPRPGDRVFLHATVFGDSGLPLEAGTVTATLTDARGRAQAVPLQAEPGGWGVFTGAAVLPEAGRHDVAVECEETGRRVATAIVVERATREVVGRPARDDVLRELAAVTGGRHGAAHELDRLVADIRLLPEPQPREERLRLWCHPAWGGLIVAVLALYWSARKLLGQI